MTNQQFIQMQLEDKEERPHTKPHKPLFESARLKKQAFIEDEIPEKPEVDTELYDESELKVLVLSLTP